MKTITTLILLALCASAQGRLNETREQCAERYGAPLKESADKTVASWQRSGIEIMAYFYESKCERIEYQKLTKTSSGLHEEFSKTEVQQLQEANGAGVKWRAKFSLLDDEYATTDESAWMLYASVNRNIVFKTRGCLEREQAKVKAQQTAKEAAEKEAAAKKLKGF